MSSGLPLSGFGRFALDERLERGIREAGFTDPRPIQVETIPAALAGRDVLGLAQTGTGKTAAFALPLLHRMLHQPRLRPRDERRPGPRVLILAPTRELALQIDAEIRTLARFSRIQTLTIFGGVSARAQIDGLRKSPEIVVGCPGRMLDLLQQRALDLSGIESLVLDEADHMFDMGFLPDIRRILAALPAQRQNLLFSATMPKEIRQLADALLRQPQVVELQGSAPASTIEHALYAVSEDRKRDLLEHILDEDDCESAIVFTRTKHRARRLAEQLSKSGHRAAALQGNMSQGQRDRAMSGFRARKFDILVATDIVARGIDVSSVSHVINFDVPTTPEAYTHRIGRTGRAEREGKARTFVTREDRDWLRATERMIGAPIPRCHAAGFEGEAIDSAASAGSQPRGRSGGGRSGGSRSGPSAGRRTARPAAGRRSSGGSRSLR